MKILWLGDLHFGEHKNDLNFFDKQLEYLEYVLQKNDYDCIIQVGDIFHNRSSVNLFILDRVVKLFQTVTKPMYITLGNHDQWKKESGDVNVLEILTMVNDKITLFKDTTELKVNGEKILFVPYLYNRNKVNEMKSIMKKNKYALITGHFDFNEYGGKESSTTVSSEVFKANTRLVVSGHFHIQKDDVTNGVRVKHIGTPYHLNRGDRFTKSGAWLHDTESGEWELLENEISIKYIDIDLNDLMNKKSYDVEGNIINLFVKTSLLQKLGGNSIERNNVLNGVVDSIKQHKPFELNVKPYRDNIDDEDKNNNKAIDINFSDLTDFSKMVDSFYKFRFKETNHSKKLLNKTKKMIKDLL